MVHIGEDYLLLQKNESKSSRRVLNSAAITSVRWYSGAAYQLQNDVVSGTLSNTGIDKADWAKRQVDKYDKNRDGQLTADEWSNMIISPARADADQNGIITLEEYRRFRTGD